ncbi:hypothetical protein H4R35_002428 [Dimargaris xerosporica]|nr:hypothetical protein H4R35_002428 [Dimargaris xerosporica]
MIVARHILHALLYSTLVCILGTVVLGDEIDSCSRPGQWALTFDDGPERGKTDVLLDSLAKANATATFFVLGELIPGNEDLLKRMQSEGHVIGIHTYSHPDLTTLSREDIRTQLQKTSKLIEGATGVKPTLMRPPYGKMNDEARQVCADLGLHIILWDIDTKDYQYAAEDFTGDTGHQEMLNNFRGLVSSTASLTSGHISLHHDIWGTTSFHGKEIVDIVAKQGFEFATIDDCMNGIPQPPGRNDPMLPNDPSVGAGGPGSSQPSRYDYPRYAVGPANGSLRKANTPTDKKPVSGRCRAKGHRGNKP